MDTNGERLNHAGEGAQEFDASKAQESFIDRLPKTDARAIEIAGANSDSQIEGLPQRQQAKLNALSQEFVDKVSEGPSSLIDQDVVRALNTLPDGSQETFWKLVTKGPEGWKALSALGREANARAKLRASVAESAEKLAEMAEQDLQRKVFDLWIVNLRRTMGSEMEIYCSEHNMDVPAEGTQAETMLLLRMHSARLAESNYRRAIQNEMTRYIREKAKRQGQLARSNMRAQMLEPLIQSREVEYPLQQKAASQKAAHIAGTATGVVSGFIVGGALGAVGGAVVATTKVRGEIGAKLIEVRETVAGKIQEAQEKAAQKRREREARKANRNR